MTNDGIEAHTITADTGRPSTSTSNLTPPPTTPGTYPYHCNFHANMKGTLTVK